MPVSAVVWTCKASKTRAPASKWRFQLTKAFVLWSLQEPLEFERCCGWSPTQPRSVEKQVHGPSACAKRNEALHEPRGKLQIPNPKSQKSSNNQIPNGLLSPALSSGGGEGEERGGSWLQCAFLECWSSPRITHHESRVPNTHIRAHWNRSLEMPLYTLICGN